MKKTAIIFSPKYLTHDPGPGHPESPQRLEVVINGLKESSILQSDSCFLIEPKPASLEDLRLVHSSSYINTVKRVSELGGGTLDLGDTVASPESFEVAQLAAGGVIQAVDMVMTNQFQNAFALIRPPGHHAGRNYALGFCIFNNAALAASRLIYNFKLDRVLILDIDAHHGNGTQEIFYSTDKVLYISLHQDPTGFPGTGFVDEVGEGKGLGYNVNIPFPFRTGDPSYWKAMKDIVIPIIQQYEPQFILVSAGFDGYHGDTVASLSLSAFIYPRIFQKVLSLAERFCEGRIVAVLEGGYKLSFLKRILVAATAQMAGLQYKIKDRRPLSDLEILKKAEKIIEDVRRTHSAFWSI